MSTSLTVSQESQGVVVSLTDMEKMAGYVVKSGLFGAKTLDQAMALMLVAQSEGIHPMKACQEYDIIQGKPAINSRSALSRFQASGGKIRWTKRTDDECSALFTHPQGGELEITWTIKRAAQAGLTSKDNWKKMPCQMLSARVAAEGVRAVFPACLSGLYTVEEVQDFDDVPRPSQAQVRQKMAQVAHLKDKLSPTAPATAKDTVIEVEIMPSDDDRCITEVQGKDLIGQIKEKKVDADAFLSYFGISRLGELKESKLNDAYDYIYGAGKE